jgi:flagellar biosynthesis/type III secretory pathway chaperone
MNIELLEALAIGQRENHKKNLDRLAKERAELLNRLYEIDRRIVKEAQEFERMDCFLGGK